MSVKVDIIQIDLNCINNSFFSEWPKGLILVVIL